MRTVHYVMSHSPHVPYLLVSLYTLRKHWSGPVIIHAWRESIDLVKRIAQDERLYAVALEYEPEYRGRNDQFLSKIKVAQGWEKSDTFLYLDADSTIHGDLAQLFDSAERYGFCATQWNDWQTNHSTTRGRLETLREFQLVDKAMITEAQANPLPSLNGGVWACKPDSPVLKDWYNWTMQATVPKHTFIADEKVLNVLQVKHSPDRFCVATGGKWNSSPVEKYQAKGLRDEEIIVRHYHGDANVRLDKHGSSKGYRIWWPLWMWCNHANLGGVRDWHDKTGNKWLAKLGK